MADTSTPTYTKDPSSGAFYIDSQSGLQLVTDSGTLQGLEQGTIPSTPQSGGTYDPAGGASYQPASATTNAQGIDSSDPYTRFNMAILDMLRTAQQGGQNQNLIAQGTALNQLQTNTNLNPTTFGGGSVAGLSPSQISQIEGANSNLYTPEQDVVSNAIKAQDSRLTTFENMWSEAQKAGTDIATMNPSPSIIESYVTGLTNGTMNITAIPDTGDLRAKVIKSMDSQQLQQWQDAQKPQIIKTTDANGNPITYAYNASTQTAIPLTNYGAQPEAPKNTNPLVNLTPTNWKNISGSGLFSPDEIKNLKTYLQDGGDWRTYNFSPNDKAKGTAQLQEFQSVMQGSAANAPTKSDMSTAIQSLETQYGTSDKWSIDDWQTRKDAFIAQYPTQASAAASAFDAAFSKPSSNTYSTIWNDITGVFSKLKVK